MSGPPYISSEDSALIRRALEGRKGGACLEIGAGNGGNLVSVSRGYGMVVGTDLSRPAMSDWKPHAGYVMAEGASCFRMGVFDLVFFNPPYVVGEGTGDAAVDGGPGLEVPKRFLRDALRVVKSGGAVVFLLNGDAKIQEFEEICRMAGFGVRHLLSQRLFYETLSVYEAVTVDARGTGRAREEEESYSETSRVGPPHLVPRHLS